MEEQVEEKEFEITLGSPMPSLSEDDYSDPFARSYKEVRELNGLNKNFIRRADRQMNKMAVTVPASIAGGDSGAATRMLEPERLLGYNYLECITPAQNLEYLSKLYEVSDAHQAAVNAKVDNIVGLGFDWVESQKTKTLKSKLETEKQTKKLEKLINDKKEYLNEWISSLNKNDEFDEILRKIWTDYEATGNAYLEVGRNKRGEIGYLGHIPSLNIRIRGNRDGFIQIIGNEAVYFRNFGEDTPNPITDDGEPNEIIHFKKYSPTSNYYGVPNIVAAMTAVAGNQFAAKFNLDYFENKAVPRYVIIAKGGRLSQASIKQLVEFFETGLRGKHHRSVYIPVPEGDAEIKFEAIEATTQDSSFNSYTETNNNSIFMVHRVPKSRAGVLNAGGGLAAARDADKIFKESVCRPEQRIIEKKLNKIFKEVTDMFVFKLSELALTDEDQQSQIDEREIRNGVVVPDEVRARKGMPPRSDGKGGEPTVLTAQQQADQKATALQSRERDANRSAASSDKKGEGRNEQGAGRRQS